MNIVSTPLQITNEEAFTEQPTRWSTGLASSVQKVPPSVKGEDFLNEGGSRRTVACSVLPVEELCERPVERVDFKSILSEPGNGSRLSYRQRQYYNADFIRGNAAAAGVGAG